MQLFRSTFADGADFCKFHDVEFTAGSNIKIGWMYPYQSILQPIFDKYLIEIMEAGIFDRVVEKYQPNQPVCEKNEIVPINIDCVAILFVILSIGIILSLFFHILENFGINLLKTQINWP